MVVVGVHPLQLKIGQNKMVHSWVLDHLTFEGTLLNTFNFEILKG